MAAKKKASGKRARGKRRNKKRLADGDNQITITPAQKSRVIDTLDTLQKDANDLASGIEDIRDILCRVDFCK
jgi:hypothetical protein